MKPSPSLCNLTIGALRYHPVGLGLLLQPLELPPGGILPLLLLHRDPQQVVQVLGRLLLPSRASPPAVVGVVGGGGVFRVQLVVGGGGGRGALPSSLLSLFVTSRLIRLLLLRGAQLKDCRVFPVSGGGGSKVRDDALKLTREMALKHYFY